MSTEQRQKHWSDQVSMADLEQVKCKDLKKGVDYILTGDFWPDGGSVVRLVKHEKASIHYRGDRGMVALVKNEAGTRYVIHPHAYLFKAKALEASR